MIFEECSVLQTDKGNLQLPTQLTLLTWRSAFSNDDMYEIQQSFRSVLNTIKYLCTVLFL